MTINVSDIERHLQEEDLPPARQSELLFFRDAALQLIALHPDLRPEVLPLDTDQPLMRFAVLELIRDMNQTQSGPGGRTFGQDFGPDAVAAFTAGRPTLPPYVEGLLGSYLRRASSDGPVGCFPAPTPWPAW